MSRSSFIHLAPLALAAIAGAGLIQPSTGSAQAVTTEQALLNQTVAQTEVSAAYRATPDRSIQIGNADVAGDRALLGRVEAPSAWEWYFGTVSLAETAIDGERALLGRWPLVQSRRSGDWAQRGAERENEES
jgi:hypothetical protein